MTIWDFSRGIHPGESCPVDHKHILILVGYFVAITIHSHFYPGPAHSSPVRYPDNMSSEVTLLDSERSREFEDNDEETDGPVGKGQLEEETRVTSSKSTPGNEGFKESSIARVEQESLNSLLVEKVSHVEKLLERIMGHSMRIVVIKNDKQRKQIERLLCTCCKLILRDAVQTVEGLRLCLCCAVYITK